MNAVTQTRVAEVSNSTPAKTIEHLRSTTLGHGRPTRPLATVPAAGVAAPEVSLPSISVGFCNLQSFEFTQRVARALAASTMVPEQYRARIPNKRKRDEFLDNPSALSNCIVALNMADRLRSDVLMVMQNLYIVEGRPAWSAQFVIGTINASGEFGRLKFDLEDRGDKTVEYAYTEWDNGTKSARKIAVTIRDVACTAWGIEKATGERVNGPTVSLEMAIKEGWYTKNGSKWQTMPDLMLRYRAGAFFGRINSPDLMMGLCTVEEERDIIDVEMNADGIWMPSDRDQQDETNDAGDVQESEQQSEIAGQSAQLTHETHVTMDDLVGRKREEVQTDNGGEGTGRDPQKTAAIDDGKPPGAAESPSRKAGPPPRKTRAGTAGAAQLPLGSSGFGSVE